jgi:hypothetical protein
MHILLSLLRCLNNLLTLSNVLPNLVRFVLPAVPYYRRNCDAQADKGRGLKCFDWNLHNARARLGLR